MEKEKSITFYLTPEEKRKITASALEKSISVSTLIRMEILKLIKFEETDQ